MERKFLHTSGPDRELPCGTSGNRTKNNWKLALHAQGKNAPITGGPDYSEAVEEITDLRQKNEQETIYPILYRAIRLVDHFKKGNGMVFTVFTVVFGKMERVANLVDLSAV